MVEWFAWFIKELVTQMTHRNDIQPMFGCVSKMVMPLGCWLGATDAPQRFSRRHPAVLDGIANSTPSSTFIHIPKPYLCVTKSVHQLNLLSLAVFPVVHFLVSLCFWCFSPFIFATFTLVVTAVFSLCLSRKLGYGLYLFALGTLFRYDVISHFNLHNRLFWLGHRQARHLLRGRSIIDGLLTAVNTFYYLVGYLWDRRSFSVVSPDRYSRGGPVPPFFNITQLMGVVT